MKTEKKSNEPSCVTTTIVKEEPDSDQIKIKEESTTGGSANDDATGEDTVECPRESRLDRANGEGTMSTENQNANGNQSILNSVKQEEHNNPADDLSDCAANIGVSADGIQPLVSNVIGKQMGTGTTGGDAQYMQQQSQIFVFSTTLANKGADAVMQGQYPSIIAYHCAQPGTKKYLEKHPNKINQFRQNPAQWLNNLAMMKQKGNQGSANNAFSSDQPTPELPNLDTNSSPFWTETSNLRNLNGGNTEPSLDDTNIDVPCLVPNSPNNSANPQPSNNPPMGHSPNVLGGNTSPGPGGLQPSLQGVKVPDENLTPQQRQHREEQLATIRKMQMMLFPEHKDEPGSNVESSNQGTPVSTCPTTTNVSSSQCPPSVDWHKLQHQFLDSKNKVGIIGGGSPGSLRGSGMIPLPRSQGPPPPYHQTTRSASVPIAIQSPNPSSPNNPTSNLSLPSPRASSALNSPADCNRQFQLNNQRSGHLPGQSPTSQVDSPNPNLGNASGAASAGTTTGNSSSRLNHSNPGTPVSHSHLTALSPNGTNNQKDNPLDFPSNQTPSVDGMFCRTLQSLAQQQKQQQLAGTVNAAGVKEANLMPVPSPQQIQYLNAFEGQELTIQKQPNTSLKEGGLSTNNNTNADMSSRIMSANLDNGQFPTRSEGASPVQMDNMNRGFPGSLHSPHTPHTPHTPGNGGTPHTPVDSNKTNNKNSASAQSSPAASHGGNITDSMGPPRTIPVSPTTKPETSPPLGKDSSQQQQQQQSQQQQQQQPPQQTSNHPNQGLGPFPCGRASDNVPLNPNNIGNRLGNLNPLSNNHFDPITSLAQMSQQLTNTAASNSLGNENSMHSNNPGMMSFGNPHHNLHMMQMPGEMNGGPSCHMMTGHNEQNEVVPPGMCMGGNLSGPPQNNSGYSPNTGTSPGMINNKMGHHMMNLNNPSVGNPYPVIDGQQHPQSSSASSVSTSSRLQMGSHHPGPSPYNGANVQVKPSAPNTIQYLPARPNLGGHAPRGPPSLDFLQRFTNPLSNLDNNKIPPTPSVNLQYFPNGCVPNSGPPGIPGMVGNSGPTRIDPGQPGQNMQTSVVGIHPSMRPNMRAQSNIMRMQHMVGGGVFPGSPMDPDKVFPTSDMIANQPNPGMYVTGISNKNNNPMGLGPGTPDASQPLPPSMGGNPSTNFKNNPFVGGGPTMSDPNYAQQFHNFQQQLYATGTRGGGNGPAPHQNLHPPPPPQPNSHSHQQFFMPK